MREEKGVIGSQRDEDKEVRKERWREVSARKEGKGREWIGKAREKKVE